jgi:hypothetical protein
MLLLTFLDVFIAVRTGLTVDRSRIRALVGLEDVPACVTERPVRWFQFLVHGNPLIKHKAVTIPVVLIFA